MDLQTVPFSKELEFRFEIDKLKEGQLLFRLINRVFTRVRKISLVYNFLMEMIYKNAF